MQRTSLFMFSQVCWCMIERTIWAVTSVEVLYHERDRANGPLFQVLRDHALSVCSTETVRSLAFDVERSLFFTLEEHRYEELATEAGRALAGFSFGLSAIFVCWSDRRRKESKRPPVFV